MNHKCAQVIVAFIVSARTDENNTYPTQQGSGLRPVPDSASTMMSFYYRTPSPIPSSFLPNLSPPRKKDEGKPITYNQKNLM